MKKNNLNNAGQVALIVLIISAIIMTLGLSISKKSVVETKITTDEELLKQAFNTAESGIEYYLGTGNTGIAAYNTGNNNADVTVKDVGSNGGVANMNVLTLANELSFTWLVPHKEDGSVDKDSTTFGSSEMNLSLCLDKGFAGAVKIDYFYYHNSKYGVKRLGYNVNSPGLVNTFVNISPSSECSIDGVNYNNIPLPPDLITGIKPLLLVVKPIGDSAKIAFISSAIFPKQAEEISSLGQAGNPSAPVNRNIKVINQYQVPSFLLEAVTASGSVLSN